MGAQHILLQGILCDVVCRQMGMPRRVSARQDQCLLDVRMVDQPGFDLPQLNTEATDLDLEVIAAQIFDVTVRQVTALIPRFIKAGAFTTAAFGVTAERIGNKRVRCRLRIVQIAAPNASATDIQLTDCPLWDGAQLFVEYIQLGITDWLTDGYGVIKRLRRRIGQIGRGVGCRFRRPVNMHQLDLRIKRSKTINMVNGHLLTAEQQVVQLLQTRQFSIHQRIKEGGRGKEIADLTIDNKLRETV
ncbi:Uncharacterised protein [Serratia fonticola]|nr:Uncharacterised protein [Serratia fonticola]